MQDLSQSETGESVRNVNGFPTTPSLERTWCEGRIQISGSGVLGSLKLTVKSVGEWGLSHTFLLVLGKSLHS